jgi:dienelactone hydrolase
MQARYARVTMRLALALALVALCAACGDGDAAGETPRAPASVPEAGADRGDRGDASQTADVPSNDAGAVTGDAAPPATVTHPAPFGCIADVTAGHHVFSCGGIGYDVEITPACASGGCGLVLDVHGLTMSAEQEDRSTKLRALGAPRGYVIVQPTAPGSALGPSWTPNTDDDKVWAVLEDALHALVIDPHRVHVTGFSQGGAMSWRMLCKHADVIASAAPIAAADGKNLDSNLPPFRLDCAFDATTAPSRPLSILQMHGTKDGLVPFDKAKLQRDAALAWLGLGVATPVGSDANYVHTRYTSPTGNVVFEFIQHDYEVEPPLLPVPLGGHCFPGGDDLRHGASSAALFFGCAPPNAFVWGNVVMDFFVAHPKP